MSMSYYSGEVVFSAGGILINKITNEVLLIFKETTGEWLLPKGHIENDETIEKTAQREIFEETGYENIIKNLLSVQVRPDVFDQSKSKIIFWFLSELSKDNKQHNTQMSNENFKSEWFNSDVAIANLKWDEDKKLVSKAFDQLR